MAGGGKSVAAAGRKDAAKAKSNSGSGNSNSNASSSGGGGGSSGAKSVTAEAKNAKYLGTLSLITFAVLTIAWITGFLSRLFSVIRFESIIHEFDPW
jgi:hypothetical protein